MSDNTLRILLSFVMFYVICFGLGVLVALVGWVTDRWRK